MSLITRSRWWIVATLSIALILVFTLSTSVFAALTGRALLQVSTDPYTNSTSQHQTEVEPDSYSNGSTIVAATQVGRFTDGGASNIGWATSTDNGTTWKNGFLPGTTVYATPAGSYDRLSDPAVIYDAAHQHWIISSLAISNDSGTPVGVAVTPDGKTAYVTNTFGNTVTPITVATSHPGTPITVGGSPVGIAITPAPRTTSTHLGVTPASPVGAGTTETLTATITPPMAVGSVQFTDGTTPLGNPVRVAGGTASITPTLPVGIHLLTAVFTPTDPTAVSGSTSPTVSYVVNAATGATATTTILTVSPNPAVPVILRATVAPPIAVGTVQFMDGTTALGAAVSVRGGHARLRTPTLAPGTHSLTAVFTPTDPATFGPSSSLPVSVSAGQSQRILLLQHLLQSILNGLHL